MRERICRMICSTSTLSDRTEKSVMMYCAFLLHEFGCLRDAGRKNTEGAGQRPGAGQLDLGDRRANIRKAVGVGADSLPVPEQPSPRAIQHVAHHPPRIVRIPEAVVVE